MDVVFPVVVVGRCVQLSAAHADILFGAPLTKLCVLAVGGFAAAEQLVVKTAQGSVAGVRVVGPPNKSSIVKVAARDAAALGVEVARSHDVAASPGCVLEGPRGTVVLAAGLLCGLRCLSVPTALARELRLENNGVVSVRLQGERNRDLRDVPVVVSDDGAGHLAIDVDDANAVDLGPKPYAILL